MHSERGKKTRRTKEEVGRQHQGMDRPGVWRVPEGSGEQGKMEKIGCKIICGAPTILAVKGLMMMMTMMMMMMMIELCGHQVVNSGVGHWMDRCLHVQLQKFKPHLTTESQKVSSSNTLYPKNYTVSNIQNVVAQLCFKLFLHKL